MPVRNIPAAAGLSPDVTDLLLRLAVLGGLVLLAVAAGLLLRRMSGRARVARGGRLSDADVGRPLGSAATFLQFSAPACTQCRHARRVLGDLAARTPGLAHVELDATERLDLARAHSILRTPTVLVLDGRGAVVRRLSGAPTAAQARAALDGLVRPAA